jgi:hypothetical protein
MGVTLSTKLSEWPSGLDATSRLDEALDGVLEGDEVVSRVIADVCVGVKRRANGDGREVPEPLSFYF